MASRGKDSSFKSIGGNYSSGSNGWQLEDKPVKIDKWDGAAVKNALDDAAKKVMLEFFGYSESHILMDMRLVICTVAVGFAMFALVWDYLNPFPKSRPILIMCVVSYFIMMSVLTAYTTFKERGCFLMAVEKDKAGVDPDNKWLLSSNLKRYDDMYHLHMTYIDGQTQKQRTAKFSKSVASFFDEDGLLHFKFFEPEVRKLHTDLAVEKKDK